MVTVEKMGNTAIICPIRQSNQKQSDLCVFGIFINEIAKVHR